MERRVVPPGGLVTLALSLVVLLSATVLPASPAAATGGGVLRSGQQFCADTYSGHPNYFGSSAATWVVDINFANDGGQPVFAPEAGTVQQVTTASSGSGWGNSIVWTSANGNEKLHMAHLSSVTATGTVPSGSQIGVIGSTGTSTGAHLHMSRVVSGATAPVVLSGVTIVPALDAAVYGRISPCNSATYTSGGPLPNMAIPPAPASLRILAHSGRVVLSWGGVGGAGDYVVTRAGAQIATAATTWTDTTVSPGQQYVYTVQARNSAGVSSGIQRLVFTGTESADRAYVATKAGPALCGRAGDQNHQGLVCTVRTSTGWVRVNLPYPGDWGYSTDRAWVRNLDGTVSYCALVGTGNTIRCETFDGTSWSTSTSFATDVAYPQDRAFVATKDGPALCGRAGNQTSQGLVCTVHKSTGWVRATTPVAGDWGYAPDRAWVTNTDGTVSYCARVGTGNQVRCDTFNGSTWSSSTSPATDPAYTDDRAYVATSAGPALCGRAGDQNNQALVCTVRKTSGWVRVATPTAGDWGYASDRAWVRNLNGTVSYCARVGLGDKVRCDTFNGSSWSSSTSPATDPAYPEMRAYVPTKDGPALCGRAGNQTSQGLVCTVRKSTGWVRVSTPYAGDWGYAPDRGWVTNTDGTLSYCALVGVGTQVRCDTFNGTTWAASVSGTTDPTYPDTF